MPLDSMPISETGEGDALAVGDRFAERLAFVDVGDDVVEDRLRGADRERGPGDPRPVDALDVVGALALAEDRGRRGRARPRGSGWPVAAGRRPIAGSSSIESPLVPDSTTKSAGPMPSASAATTKSSHSVARAISDLAPSSTQSSPSRRGRRLQLQRVEQRPRLEDRQRRGGDVLAGEGGQVGRLLLGRAPEADRGGDRAGGERRVGDPHVAVGERLADQRRWSSPRPLPSRRRARPGRRASRRRARSPGRAAPAASCARRRPLWRAGRTLSAAKARPASWNICCSSSGVTSKRPFDFERGWRAGLPSCCAALKVRPAAVAVRKPCLVPWKRARSTPLRMRMRSSRSEPASQFSPRRPMPIARSATPLVVVGRRRCSLCLSFGSWSWRRPG